MQNIAYEVSDITSKFAAYTKNRLRDTVCAGLSLVQGKIAANELIADIRVTRLAGLVTQASGTRQDGAET